MLTYNHKNSLKSLVFVIPQDASQAVVGFHHSGALSNCIIWEGMEISFYPEFYPSSVNFQASLCLPKSFQT